MDDFLLYGIRMDTTFSKFEYITDTATIAVFDIQSLKHRLDDIGDWWTIPEDEVLELNEGNLIIAALPGDGKYSGTIVDGDITDFEHCLSANLDCPSGDVFVGAGEHITGEEMEPKDWPYLRGAMVRLDPGNYKVSLHLNEGFKIRVRFERNSEALKNSFDWPLELGR